MPDSITELLVTEAAIDKLGARGITTHARTHAGREQPMSAQTPHVLVAATAALLRQNLKATHPRIEFAVRSQTYAGGASIDVAWTDGPTEV